MEDASAVIGPGAKRKIAVLYLLLLHFRFNFVEKKWEVGNLMEQDFGGPAVRTGYKRWVNMGSQHLEDCRCYVVQFLLAFSAWALRLFAPGPITADGIPRRF